MVISYGCEVGIHTCSKPTLTSPSLCVRRQGRPQSFVQELFGLLMQAPCPVDYQDSPTATTRAPERAAAAASSGTQEGSPRTADDGQSWRRQNAPAASGRGNAQVTAEPPADPHLVVWILTNPACHYNIQIAEHTPKSRQWDLIPGVSAKINLG